MRIKDGIKILLATLIIFPIYYISTAISGIFSVISIYMTVVGLKLLENLED
jgi:hypothetical protein